MAAMWSSDSLEDTTQPSSSRDAGSPSTPRIGDSRPKSLKELKHHVQRLASLRWGDNQSDGFDYEFNLIEKKTECDQTYEDCSSAKLPENRSKNRYSNVLPFESTRVLLPPDIAAQIGSSSYINANYITKSVGIPRKKAYIACQGCLKDTVPAFWSMVWSEGATLIVMLTTTSEGVKQKCFQYWSNKRPKVIQTTTKEPLFSITSLDPKPKDDQDLIARRFQIKHHPSGETREIAHLQYVEWPDHKTPKNTDTFRHLLRLVEAARPRGPIIVHCSAGIGRTGTFCTVHMNLSHLFEISPRTAKPQFDVLGTVLRLRKERIGMVQTKEQYMFCYLAILEGALEWKRAHELGIPWEMIALPPADTPTDSPLGDASTVSLLLHIADGDVSEERRSSERERPRSSRRSRSKGPKERITKVKKAPN